MGEIGWLRGGSLGVDSLKGHWHANRHGVVKMGAQSAVVLTLCSICVVSGCTVPPDDSAGDVRVVNDLGVTATFGSCRYNNCSKLDVIHRVEPGSSVFFGARESGQIIQVSYGGKTKCLTLRLGGPEPAKASTATPCG